mgnify:FL=1
MCPCHHESPNDLTRKYDFYVYPNSIMTFFSKVNISHFFNDKKEADNLPTSYSEPITPSLFSFIRFLSDCNLVFDLVIPLTCTTMSNCSRSCLMRYFNQFFRNKRAAQGRYQGVLLFIVGM